MKSDLHASLRAVSIALLCALITALGEGCAQPDRETTGREPLSDDRCGSLGEFGAIPSDHALPVGVIYGYDRPFVSASRRGDETEPLTLSVEYGLQGGHHADLSLRFVGSLDPDLIDLSIELSVDEPLRSRYRGEHDTRGWYLLFAEDEEPQGCYFHRVRIFLFDDQGAPVQAWGVEELDGSLVSLTIALNTGGDLHQWRARGVLRDTTSSTREEGQ